MSKTQKVQRLQGIPVMAGTGNHSKDIENGAPIRQNQFAEKPAGKGLTVIYRQEIIQDVTLFTSQSAAKFYTAALIS